MNKLGLRQFHSPKHFISAHSLPVTKRPVLKLSASAIDVIFASEVIKIEAQNQAALTAKLASSQLLPVPFTGLALALETVQDPGNLGTIIRTTSAGAGLSAELAALSDLEVRIPLSPGVESLNMAIAAALMLYEAQRQRGFNP